MNLTLKQKRELVREFKSGVTIFYIAACLQGVPVADGSVQMLVQNVIRDYMNGKFKLTPARRDGKR